MIILYILCLIKNYIYIYIYINKNIFIKANYIFLKKIFILNLLIFT